MESSDQKNASMSESKNLYLMLGIGFLIVCAIVGYRWFYHANSDGLQIGTQNIVVIDTGKIIGAATRKLLSDSNASASSTSELAVAMNAAINTYKNKGSIILNTYSVIYVPPEMDKTNEVAEKIGVILE
jgi:hypothetical protein